MPAHNSIAIWSVVIGPISPMLAGLYAFLGFLRVTIFMLTLNEAVVVRFLILRFWRRHPPINEDFFGIFALLANVMLSALFALIMYMTNGLLRQQWILMGNNLDEMPDDLVRFRLIGFLIFVTVVIHLASVSLFA